MKKNAAPKPRSRRPQKRQYLARDDRRLALLDVAASVVETQGWSALTMISVADTAKVSRQLIYQHFSSIDELMADTMAHLLQDAYEHVRAHIGGDPDDLPQMMSFAENLTFDLPPARARALWQMMTAHNSGNAETTRMSRRLRHLLTKLWTPLVGRAFELDEANSHAVVWMLIMAFWGGLQLVDDGEISRDNMTKLFGWMIERMRSGTTPTPAPERRSRRREGEARGNPTAA
ncbi:MAG TPA: TetR/AcrR family transcriptional regulator [Solimonas sp.]|nr:TetR/AcrR family transcriptional regulator [Solimonas sp.]